MNWMDRLREAPRKYTPIPFWFLNDTLDAEEMRRQLRDFCAHGVYGVVLHPRMGMDPELGYLSEAFFAALRPALEEAAALGMRVVLYDEGMYPSGSAGGLVVRDHPELASRGLALTEELQPGDAPLCRVPGGWLAERFSGGTIRGVHAGEDDGEPHAPPSADILNPEAVARFIALTHERYWQHFAPYFGSTVIAFFTDEPCILGRNARGLAPWTKDFGALFTAAGGRLEDLAALFSGGENEGTRLYRRLILQREEEVYYAALSAWCEAHGIALMGHPEKSDDIEVERFFQIPGQDLVYRWVGPETGDVRGVDSTMGKCGADIARLTGRPRNANECFGACGRAGNPWLFPGEDAKWFIDYLAVRGVNLFVPHAFYYSLRGERSAERPPDMGPGSIWWPHYRLWSGYMTRLSCLMSETELQCGAALGCRNRDLVPELAAPLFMGQRGFQYLPESFWAECEVRDGRLHCRGRSYGAALNMDGRFPGVPEEADAVPPDCLCEPPQPGLRCGGMAAAAGGLYGGAGAGRRGLHADCGGSGPLHEDLHRPPGRLRRSGCGAGPGGGDGGAARERLPGGRVLLEPARAAHSRRPPA